jgi:hypothetical protein
MTTTLVVYSNDELIGAIQVTVSNVCRKAGTQADGEIISIKGEYQRMRLDEAKLSGIVRTSAVHIIDDLKRIPLKIVCVERDDADNITVVETLHDVFITETGLSYHTDEWVIIESCKFDAGNKT